MTDTITCEAGQLAKALKDLASLARGDGAIDNVLIHYDDDIIYFTTTNLTQQMERRTTMKTGKSSGSFLVNATKLASVAGSFSSDADLKMEIDNSKGSLIVKSGRSRFTFSTADAETFPIIPRGRGVRIALSSAFREALEGVRHAVCQNEVHWDICGVALAVHGGVLEAFATDGNRIAIREVGDYDMPSIMLPTQAIDLILRSDFSTDADAEMEIEENMAWIEFGHTVICSKRIDTKPRDVHRLIGWDAILVASTDRKEMIASLSRILLVASDRDRSVSIDIAPKKGMTLSNAAGREEISCAADGEIRIGFKAEFLKSSLESLMSDTVEIHMRGPFDPAMITGKDEPDAKIILMPYRIGAVAPTDKEMENV